VSLRSVQRILEAHQLAPHRIWTFKLSNDQEFVEKLRDIVGLYVDPPAHAVVLSVDEKSQIQALDRTQPGLPMVVADLQAAINRFVEETNSNPKPFVGAADPKRVLAAVKRGKEKLESIH
jgi:hypothetical protein